MRNACSGGYRFLEENGFENKQGSVYFAVGDSDAVACIAVLQASADAFDWFTSSIKDIRMLRIEDYDDLMPVIDRKHRRERP